ncbi:MAG: glutaredoxin [Aquificae bacterium]|nr:glutaredoxin [Aquificota bacterium]
MFPEDIAQKLKEKFKKLDKTVLLKLFKDNSKLSEETEKLLKDIASLSEKIKLEVLQPTGCIGYPCIQIGREDGFDRIKFLGKPDGGEFPAFIDSILKVSTNSINLSERTLEFLSEVDKPVKIKVFITKSCGWCPPTILKLFDFALGNENIQVCAVDSYAFMDMAMEYGVATVPKAVINDKVEFVGYREENEILGYIFEALRE